MLNAIFFHQHFELVVATYESKPEEVSKSVSSFQNGKICPEYLAYSKRKAHKYPEINVYYGPYECNKLIKYRPQKLDGFITFLKNMSYDVRLIPFGFLNTVEVVCMGYLIYKFDIRYFKFNMPYKDDPVCIRAASVIDEAIHRLYGENNFTRDVTKKNNSVPPELSTISISIDNSFTEYVSFID